MGLVESDTPHSVFESTIRYIGGLLSAYELSGSAFPVLVQKSKELADKLVYAWVGVKLANSLVRSFRD